MSKAIKLETLPKLRFPSFSNNSTWKLRKLSEVLIEHGLRSTGVEEVYSVSVHKGVVNQIEHLGRSFSAANTDHYKLVNSGDLIYTKSPTGNFPYGIIKQSKVSKPVIVSPLYGVFKPETYALGTILDAYFEYRENTINYLSSIIQKGAKNTINIKNEVFLSKSLILPLDPQEQQKIASCLSSLNDLVSAYTKRIEALKKCKKGLIQRLFPTESEKPPKLRFAEFKSSGEWEQNVLDNIAVFLKGKGIPKSEINHNAKQPCIRYGELYTQYGEVIDLTVSFTDLPIDDLILSEANDVIIPSSGETREDIAKASCVLRPGIALGGDLNIIRSQINGIFLSYYLSHVQKSSIAKLAQGDAVVHLYSSQLKKLPISYPKTSEEQNKIARCLLTLDESIAAQLEKIEQIKKHKRGLMQALFPSTKESINLNP